MSDLTALDIFKATNLQNLNLEKDHAILTVDGVQHTIAYSDMRVLEALLLRLVSKVEVLIDTSTIFTEEQKTNLENK